MPRYTPNGLWKDRRWRRAACEVKAIYLYLWEACDLAGYWDVDVDEVALYCHVPTNERAGMFDSGIHTVEQALDWLTPHYIWRGVDYIWLRHYLQAQRSLPLNPHNPMHRAVLKRIAEHPDLQAKVLKDIDENQSPTEAPPKGQGIVRNSKGISKGISKGSKGARAREAELVVAAGLTQADAAGLISRWNTKARKKCDAAESLALEMVLRQVLAESPDIGWSDIEAAVDNYHAASAVPATRAGNFRLTNFVRRLPGEGRCYLPAFFDLDNYGQGGSGETTAVRLARLKGATT